MKSVQSEKSKTSSKKQSWSKHITDWQKSNLSQERYCGQAGIKFSAFCYWRTRLRKEERNVELTKPNKSQALFKQAIINPPTAAEPMQLKNTIIVTLANKTVIVIPFSLETNELKIIFTALGGLT